MAEINEPHLRLPARQMGSSFESDNGHRDTVGINIPPRTAPENLWSSCQSSTPVNRAPILPDLDESLRNSSLPVPSIAQPVFSAVHSPSLSEPLVDLTAPPSAPPAPAPLAHRRPVAPTAVPPPPASSPGPKKETARIAIMPEPKAAVPTVKMSKIQPLITASVPVRQTARILIEPETSSEMIESIPVLLCWALLGISAVIFIIQLWTYFS
jgi:hypothetical protein